MPFDFTPFLSTVLRVIVLPLIVIYICVCGWLFLNQERLLFAPEVLPANFSFSFAHPFTEVYLPVDGAILHALHFQQSQPRGVIVYFHGNAGSVRSWGAVATPLVQAGYDVVIADYRGFGKSTGTISSEAQLHQDALAVYQHVKRIYPDEAIILYGRSLGSGIVVQLATQVRPRFLILETPYTSLQAIAARQLPWVPTMLLKYPLRSDERISDVTSPIYFIHGTHDELIPYESSLRLQEHSTAPTALFTISAGTHNNLASFAEYKAAITAILLQP
jgi:hypothetical protein